MSKNNTSQSALFSGPNNKPVTMMFDQPASSSDAGAILLGRIEARHGLIVAVSAALQDSRDQNKVRHSLGDVVAQRVYGIACGYEDGNDAKDLRHDPVQKLLLDRQPVSGAELASQPTLSRFENSITVREAIDMNMAQLNWVVERHRKRLGAKRVKNITIDLDATVDETHGVQQGSLFNGFYRSHCYLPMLGFLQFNNESEQFVFAGMLKPGNSSARSSLISILNRTLPRLRAAFPRARILVRLDGGFASSQVFDYLDSQGVDYVAGIASNKVLSRLAEELMENSRTLSSDSGNSERHYGSRTYQAGTWNKSRRVVIKAEVTRYRQRDPRDNARFLITNLKHAPQHVYEQVYAPRGDVENRIKELKSHLNSDRTSCTRFIANQVRLTLSILAFTLYQELRLAAKGTRLERAQVNTLRDRIIKLGAWIKQTTRGIRIHLPESAPYRSEWLRIFNAINPTPT